MKRYLDKAVDAFLGVLILAMTAVIFVAVFWRYVLNVPLGWPDEIARLMVVWLCFIGAYMAMRERRHIGFDILVKKLSPAVRSVVDVINRLVMVVFLLVVIWQGFLYAREFVSVPTEYIGISLGVFAYSVLPLSGILMLLQAVLNLVADLRKNAQGG